MTEPKNKPVMRIGEFDKEAMIRMEELKKDIGKILDFHSLNEYETIHVLTCIKKDIERIYGVYGI